MHLPCSKILSAILFMEFAALFKGADIYIHHLQGNPNSGALQFKVAYRLALAVGGAAQLAAAHCPNEWSLEFGPTVAARQTNLCPSQPHCGLHSAMFSGNDSQFY